MTGIKLWSISIEGVSMSAKSKRLFLITFIVTIAAIATHVYLTQHHYQFKYGESTEAGICNINSTVNCETTTASSYSEIFGIPVSIFGGLVNLAFLFLLILYRFPLVQRPTQIAIGSLLKIMALAIFAVSVVMAIISYGLLHTLCPACSTAYVLSLISLVTTWMMISEKAPLFSAIHLKIYAILAGFILFFAFMIHKSNMRSYGGDEMNEIMQLQLEQWQNTPAKNFTPINAITMNPNPSAKIKVVEFADYLCGHCAHAYPIIHEFMELHSDVEFSFQAWPLDGACNKAIPNAEGTRCLLARLAQCADRQGQAWKTQEWIFENQRQLLSQDQVKNKLKEKASDLNLDYDKLFTCAESSEIRDIIRDQANVGTSLDISGTPSLFINGKKVPGGFSVPLLNKIYRKVKSAK